MRITHRTALLGVAAMLAVTAAGCGSETESSTASPAAPVVSEAPAASDGAADSDSISAAPPTPGQEMYTAPDSTVLEWVGDNAPDERAEVIRTEIGEQPMARWFGSWSDPVGEGTESFTSAAYDEGQLPIMVAYNISGRDACGGHSGGGAGSPEAYSAWIEEYADGISDRPAVIILEPDSLGDYECMSDTQIAERQDMLNGAIDRFAERAPNAWVYLDAGNPGWVDAETMAERLHAAGVEGARGFSLNVSNYLSTEDNIAYAQSLNEELESNYGYTKPFVIDTSRNAKGEEGVDWCNPAGQQIGDSSRWGDEAEMLLWIKTPGESDGDCGVGEGSEAGEFLPDVAYDLISGS